MPSFSFEGVASPAEACRSGWLLRTCSVLARNAFRFSLQHVRNNPLVAQVSCRRKCYIYYNVYSKSNMRDEALG